MKIKEARKQKFYQKFLRKAFADEYNIKDRKSVV